MLFDDALEKYLAEISRKKAKSTHRRELYLSKALHLFFRQTLQPITPTIAARFKDIRSGEVQAATVIKDLNMLPHIYTIAIREWGVEAINPLSIIRKPNTPPGRLRFMADLAIRCLLKESKKANQPNLYHLMLL